MRESDFHFDLAAAIVREHKERQAGKKSRRRRKMQVVVLPPGIPAGSGLTPKQRRERLAQMERRGA